MHVGYGIGLRFEFMAVKIRSTAQRVHNRPVRPIRRHPADIHISYYNDMY